MWICLVLFHLTYVSTHSAYIHLVPSISLCMYPMYFITQGPLPCCKVEGEAVCLPLSYKLEVTIPKQVWSRWGRPICLLCQSFIEWKWWVAMVTTDGSSCISDYTYWQLGQTGSVPGVSFKPWWWRLAVSFDVTTFYLRFSVFVLCYSKWLRICLAVQQRTGAL